jgi:hypothetical protein
MANMTLDEANAWTILLSSVLGVSILYLASLFFSRLLLWDEQVSFHLRIALGLPFCALLGLLTCWLPSPVPLALLMIAGGLGAIWSVRMFRAVWYPGVRDHRLYDAFAIGALLFSVGPAISLPAGWDELVYHITLPQRWRTTTGLPVYGDLPYSGLPSLAEILFWEVAPIEGFVTPRLLAWLAWFHGLMLFGQSLSKVVAPAVSRCMVWAFGLSNVSLLISANCYVEAFVWLAIAALLYVLVLEERKVSRHKRYMMLGILIGGAIATKLTSVGLLLVPLFHGLCSIFRSPFYERPDSSEFERVPSNPSIALDSKSYSSRDTQSWAIHSFSDAIKMATACCGWAVLFAIPFYLRPLVYTGNPFFPYFASWFSSDPTMLAVSSFHHDLATGKFGLMDWFWFPIAPFLLSNMTELYDGDFGFQWLAMLILCGYGIFRFQRSRLPTLFITLLISATALYPLWFATSQQARFGIPFAFLVAFASAMVVDSLQARASRWVRPGMLVLAIISVMWQNVGYYLDSWLYVIRWRTPLEYVTAGTTKDYGQLLTYLRNNHSDDRILLLFEHRLAYLPSGAEIATPYFQTRYLAREDNSTTNEIAESWQNLGVDLIVITNRPVGPDVLNQWLEKQQLLVEKIQPLVDGSRLKAVCRTADYSVLQLEK